MENISYWTRRRHIRAAVACEIENINTQYTASAVLHSSQSETENNEDHKQGLDFEDVSGAVSVSLSGDESVRDGNMEIGDPSEESVVTASERILEGDMFLDDNESVVNASERILEGDMFLDDSEFNALSLYSWEDDASDNDIPDDNCESENDMADEMEMIECDNEDFSFKLSQWAVARNISQKALKGLLKILRQKCPFLPKDPRSLLGTDTAYSKNIIPLSGGFYFHFGARAGIVSRLSRCSCVDVRACSNVELKINTDGLPLTKSVGNPFWPILCMIQSTCLEVKKPFVAGLYHGKQKPSNTDFLNPFVEEMKVLEKFRMDIGEAHYAVKICCFICDAPARAFVKRVKSHNGYYGSEKCKQSGERVGKVTFPETDSDLRCDQGFKERTDENHHHDDSPLSELCVGTVSGFPLDYMHLVCLGVQRKLISLWISGPLKVRLGSRVVKLISESLINLRSCIPKEFARKPRSLSEVVRWKATEFRQFLLYTGIVVLKDYISQPLYNNFLTLFIGTSILACQEQSAHYSYAKDLLKFFVQEFCQLYGSCEMVCNIHNLVHLADDAQQFGALDNFSAFPFENYLGMLKKLVRKSHLPLQQVIHRLHEQKSFSDISCNSSIDGNLKFEHSNGPLTFVSPNDRQFQEIALDGFCVKCQTADNCVGLDGKAVPVENIVQREDGSICIVYRRFCELSDFFTYPLKSASLKIYAVGKLKIQGHEIEQPF